MDTVLIADNYLGFVFWLGRLLGEAGYQVLPVKRIASVAHWAAQFEINVLVINPVLKGAADFIRSLRALQGRSRAIIQIGEQAQELDGVYVWMQKPEEVDDLAALRWLKLIESAMASLENPKPRHSGSFL